MWNLFKVNHKDTKKRQWHCSSVYIVNFEQISNITSNFSLMTLNKCRLGSSWINTRSKLGMLQLRRIQFVVSLQPFKHRTQPKMYCCGIFQNFRDTFFWHSFSTADLESKQFWVGENECGYLLHSRRQIIWVYVTCCR